MHVSPAVKNVHLQNMVKHGEYIRKDPFFK